MICVIVIKGFFDFFKKKKKKGQNIKRAKGPFVGNMYLKILYLISCTRKKSGYIRKRFS